MTPLYLDIETIPTQNQRIVDEIAAGIKHPGNMSKPETIAKWEAEVKPLAIREAVAATSFDGAYGECIMVGLARETHDIEVLARPKLGDEAALLVELFKTLDLMFKESERMTVQVVGHRVVDFDLRFLWQRAVIYGIRPPAWLPWHARPWEDRVFDTMGAWAGYAANKYVTLDKLCGVMGVARKGTEIGEDIDGSKVWQFWREGRVQDLITYCAGDVSRVRELHARMTFLPTMYST